MTVTGAERDRLAALTRDEAVACARDLAAGLVDRRAETEAIRRVPDATMEEFVASGLMRLNQAERWGGPELGTAAITEVIAEVAKGDASAGWVFGVIANHFWLACLFPPELQEEMWGSDPNRDDVVVVRGDRGIVRAGRGRVPGLGTLAVLERLGPLLVGDGRVRPAARRARRVPPARLGRHASQRLHGGRRVAHGRHAGHGLQHAGRGGRVHPRPPVPRSLADRRGHPAGHGRQPRADVPAAVRRRRSRSTSPLRPSVLRRRRSRTGSATWPPSARCSPAPRSASRPPR